MKFTHVKLFLFVLVLLCCGLFAVPAFASQVTGIGMYSVSGLGGTSTASPIQVSPGNGYSIPPGATVYVRYQQSESTNIRVYTDSNSSDFYNSYWKLALSDGSYVGGNTPVGYYNVYNGSFSADSWAKYYWYGSGLSTVESGSLYTEFWFQNTGSNPIRVAFQAYATSGAWTQELTTGPLTTDDYVLRWEGKESYLWDGAVLTNPYAYDLTVDVTTNSNDVANENHGTWNQVQLTGKVLFNVTPDSALFDFWGNNGTLAMKPISGSGFNVYGLTDSRASGRLYGQLYKLVYAEFIPDQSGYSPCYFTIDLSAGSGQLVHGVAGGGKYGTSPSDPGTSTVLPSPMDGPSASDNNSMASNGLDFQPLVQVGDTIKTKFPFSLPWDFYDALSGFGAGTTVAPTFDISVNHPPLMVFNQTIDLSMWNPIMPAVRAILLISFSVTLVFAFSKLVGGGGD